MDDPKLGRIVRALRRRLGCTQAALALKAGCSQSMVSLVERGHLDRVSLRVVRQILAALDASLVVSVQWRAGALERLLDEGHAALVGVIAQLLGDAGWLVETEVTYSHFGERGSYDLLAFHPLLGVRLVVEVKTELPSVEQTLRKMDEKSRLAPIVARQRFGWEASEASRLLIMPDDRGLRRRVSRHEVLFNLALPSRSVAARRWVALPTGGSAGLWFLTLTNGRSGIHEGAVGSGCVRRERRHRAMRSLPDGNGSASGAWESSAPAAVPNPLAAFSE